MAEKRYTLTQIAALFEVHPSSVGRAASTLGLRVGKVPGKREATLTETQIQELAQRKRWVKRADWEHLQAGVKKKSEEGAPRRQATEGVNEAALARRITQSVIQVLLADSGPLITVIKDEIKVALESMLSVTPAPERPRESTTRAEAGDISSLSRWVWNHFTSAKERKQATARIAPLAIHRRAVLALDRQGQRQAWEICQTLPGFHSCKSCPHQVD